MKVIVGKHKIKIQKEIINEKEINITKCKFEFDENITEEFVKDIYFTLNDTTIKIANIQNNECDIPYEILIQKGMVELGVVAYLVEDETEIKRYNPSPAYFDTYTGSIKEEYDNYEPITPSDKEQMEQAINDLENSKQDVLVSGENIKTINGESVLGEGNIEINIDLDDYYTKEQTDDKLDLKQDKSSMSDYYNKSEIDGIKTTIEEEIPTKTSDLTNDSGYITGITSGDVTSALGYTPADTNDIPTKTSDLVNDNGFITNATQNLANYYLKNETYSQSQVNDLINAISTMSLEAVQTLPTQDISTTTIYLVPKQTAETQDIYDEFVYINNEWEHIGSTEIDLSNYYNKTQTDALLSGKQANITSSNKLNADLVDDTNSTNKFVTSAEKTTWNNKSDFSGDYNDLTNKPTIPTQLNQLSDDSTHRLVTDTEKSNWNAKVGTTDYATSSTGGVIKTNSGSYGVQVIDGFLAGGQTSYANYENKANQFIISKGTLENVITGKQLVNQTTLDNSFEMTKTEDVENGSQITDGTGYARLNKIYGNTEQNSYTGKNLFDINSVTSVTNGSISNQIITSDETSATNYSVYPYFSNISLSSGTYYLSMDIRIKTGTGTFNKINDSAIEWTEVSKPTISSNFQRYVYSHTYTENTNLNHILIQFINSTNAIYEIKNIMLSTSSDTTYEPFVGGSPSPSPDYPQSIKVVTGDNTIHISNSDNTISQEFLLSLGNIELCKIGTYQDYIYKNNGNWYKHSEIGKIVLDGSEDWYIYNNNLYLESVTDYKRQNNIPFCSHYKGIAMTIGTITPSVENENTIRFGNNINLLSRLFIIDTDFSNVADFKTWLSTHNIEVYYVLATPTDEEITDTTLISQLETIYNFTMYLGVTNFTISSESSLPSLNITYAIKNRDFYSKEETDDLLDKKADKIDVENALNEKQNTLVSGTNIKTINNQSILGSGNITIQGGSGSTEIYNSVSDMKSADLQSGTYAVTSGYYEKNDGGASKYLIRNATISDVDNGGSIIILNNENVAELIVENDTIHVMQFGIQENTDILTKLNTLASFVASADIGNVVFATNGVYELSGAVVFNTDKLTIWGNNASIKVQDGIYRALRVYGDTLSIYDLTIDGSDTRQDQWSDTRYPGNMTNIYALSTDCTNVYLNNFNITNLWGQGIMALNYNNYIIENCTFNKIGGGFYYTDPETGANDNFGDALHFGGHNGTANIILNNFYAEGYTTTLNGGRKSRGGLVLEDFVGTTYSPDNTHVTMNNCQLINFNRVFHYEGLQSPTTIKLTNGKIVQDDSICVPEYACDLIIENSEINHTELNYGGSNSFRGYNTKIKDSVINIANGATNSLVHACKCEYDNCTINNVNNTSLMNGTGIFRRCTLNFNGIATYFMYNSTGIFKDCIFNNSSTASDLQMTKSGSKIQIFGCTFNNIKPYGIFKDIDSILYLVSSTITDDLKGEFCTATLYKKNNGVWDLIAKPNINQVFNATKEINIDSVFTQVNFGSNSSIPLFPATLPDGFVWKPNSKYIMICYGANADYLKYIQKFTSACYFVSVKTNTSGVPSVDGTVIASTDAPSGYNRELSFNTTNNTISKGTASSNVSRVMYWILPYNYYNEIAQI